ncbi:hypothetical protein [Cyanobium sp. FACHB-13342]|uniref:hypothetical protein n=1 Tax=Cyanobium sp. FACHB-13342 TaxID=2692793 RepID=UPI0016807FDE|nr:hypothetical protein [Cyanobium sp. FACHB-13342]MBD2421914.1 hypothetical protein [Cyanobium sp. FACHB-13342]
MTPSSLGPERTRSVVAYKLAGLLRAAEADQGRHGAEAWRRKLEPLVAALAATRPG